VAFRSVEGRVSAPKARASLIHDWTFSQGSVPREGGENVRINLWLYGERAPKNKQPCEVVIRKFEFVAPRPRAR